MKEKCDGDNPATFNSNDLDGNLHIEYIKDHGYFADLPFESVLNGFRSAYSEDMINRWMESNLQTEKVKLTKIKGPPDAWKVDIDFKYYF